MPILAQPAPSNAPKLCPVNQTSIASSVDGEETRARTVDGPGWMTSVSKSADAIRCFHCGERCAATTVDAGDRNFCCGGCQTVFALLTECGLGQFYELAAAPGARVGRTTAQRHWAFLDDLVVQEKLLDFADERRAKVTLHLPSIHCVACVWLLENLFRLRAGIGDSRVDFVRREVSLSFDRTQVKLSEIAALLASLGYEPSLTFEELDGKASGKAPAWRQRQWLQVGIAGFGFGNVMLLTLPGYLGLDSSSGPWFKALAGWLGLGLSLPVLVYSASDFWRSAWLSVRRRAFTLDVPIAIGLAAIYAQSVFEVVSGRGGGYCDSLTGLIFFLLCGRLFQRKTFDRLAFDRDYKGFFPLAVTRRKQRPPENSNSLPDESGEIGSRENSGTTFPLTPALSPGERENDRPPKAKDERVTGIGAFSNVFECTWARDICPPLPGGEGRGEGEPSVQPPTAPTPAETSEEETVSISQLVVGDRVVLRHGELVPADARLIHGEGCVDYSFVTGESAPVTRRVGEHLFAGGRQMGGAIEVETVKPVSESYLTSLWNNEAFRKQRDDDLDSLTNRYSRRFTLAVVGVAIGAAVFWWFTDASVAMKAFTSVLIVACPCALALAAPLTLGTAQRWLGRRNVFLRNAQVIERMGAVDAVVFDKTGTLTSPGANGVTWKGTGLSGEEEGRIHSLTRHSAHPLAVRIGAAMAMTGKSPVQSFVETTGCGMEARVGGREICLGSTAWLASRGFRTMASAPVECENGRPVSKGGRPLDESGLKRPNGRDPEAAGSAVHVIIDGDYRGHFILENALRPEVGALIRQLRGTFRLVLLSGDNALDAGRFRALLGEGARVEFNQSPFDKLDVIRELQAAGHKVMMVGDGLNDAGALKQADVGVAVVEKVGTFSPASDVILDAAQLPRLADVLAFSRRAARVVRAGFVVSGLYNVVGVSIAATGLLSPLICAVLMPLSSVTVVLFAIGATRWMARRTFDVGGRRDQLAPTWPGRRVNLPTSVAAGEGLS